jgi:TM2 domain-containing membrane protein YozV
MYCPRCGRDNPLTAKYCNECGLALQEIHTILQKSEDSAETPDTEINGPAVTSMEPAVPVIKEDWKKQYIRSTSALPDSVGALPPQIPVSPPAVSQPEKFLEPVSEQPSVSLPARAVPESSHVATPTRIRNPSAAVALSLIPGLGQVYNGMLVRGVILFAATLLGLFIFIVPGVCIWIYSIYDAYQAAEKINRGEIAVST